MRKTFVEAIRQATIDEMKADPSVILIGEGVPDPKAVFGTTKGLQEEFGCDRVFDMPVSENGMTGVCIGAAIAGLKPILVHQRIDFSLYAMDQLVNNAAKWHSMYGGRAGSVPLVVRAIIGRGWGQGNQHSQCLSHIYATFPGLKVVVPASAKDAYSLLRASIQDPNPVVFIEHRWLHYTESEFDMNPAPLEIGLADKIREGTDITIVSWSYMTIEAIKIHNELKELGISVEVIDMRSIRPLDINSIRSSVFKTGRLLVLEEAWEFNSLSGEIITQIIEDDLIELKCKPMRVTLPDCYAPSTPHLTKYFYPTITQVIKKILRNFEVDSFKEIKLFEKLNLYDKYVPHDIPDNTFKGPF